MLRKGQEIRVLEGDYEGLIGILEGVTIDATTKDDRVTYVHIVRMFDNALLHVHSIETVPDGYGMTHYHSTEYIDWMKRKHPKME